MNNRLIKSNDAGGGACTNTVDLYNPFPDGGGLALYQLNGNATDVSGNYNGTATNVTYGAGEFGQAGVFNGTSSYIDLPSNSLNFLTTYSMSAWINSSNSVTGAIAANWGWPGSGAELGWLIRKMTDNKIRVTNSNGTIQNYNSTGTIPLNTWTNVVITNTQSEIKIYINGSLDSTHSSSGFTVNAGYPMNPLIGAYKYQSTYDLKFTGSIDQVRIFSRALRPYEVEALYTEEYCTPTIVPSEHFNTVTYTGTGSTGTQIPVGFQPDFVWFKNRSDTDWHILQDSVRGVDKSLFSNATDAEETYANFIQQFNATGYTIGSDAQINQSGLPYVAWNFKAGGAAVTNTDGTITSQVSANTEAGFSVVSYTGVGYPNATTAEVGHGLDLEPELVIIKKRGGSGFGGGGNWTVGLGILPSDNWAGSVYLNTTDAYFTGVNYFWNGAPTSSVIKLKNDWFVNGANNQYIAYAFHSVEGFSNFGSYVGTGVSGNTVVTGFEPAFVMIKLTSVASDWFILDNKRDTTNPRNNPLYPNLSNAEGSLGTGVNFLSNGFDFTGGSLNTTGVTFIYMAFAADPTTIEPSLEDSFNTVTYTGNGGTQSVTGVGFQPDLVWAKRRSSAEDNVFFDSVRGVQNQLVSNKTNAESTKTNALSSFDSNGFTTGDNNALNTSGQNYVSWNWKGAELPAINSNGSIPSVVSANPAAGFSIVSYTGNGLSNQTIGHGLGDTPSIVITKNRNKSGNLDGNWAFGFMPNSSGAYLNLTAAFDTGRFNDIFGSGTNSNTFTVSTGGGVYGHTNGNGDPIIAYCFAEVAGFSKFGSYSGNGTSQTIYTTDDGTSGGANGFEPAFVMLKRINASGYPWAIADNKRVDGELLANVSDAERNENTPDFISNGFTFTSARYNDTGEEWIYMAFANQF